MKLEFPKAVRCAGCVATSGVDVVSAQLFASGADIPEPRPAKLFATAKIDGRTVRVPVAPCDEYEQAFAWKHLVPAETFLIMSRR